MANFSASDVKKLRDMTGAGMMDAKKALDEADGDFDAAIDILRTKGAAKAAKRGAERVATAGLVAHAAGVLVELKCETDFVAKSDDFIAAAQRIADAASEAKPADVEALKAVPAGDQTVDEIVEGLAVSIGEKIELGRVRPLRRPRRGLPAQARGRPAARHRRPRRVRRQRGRRTRRRQAGRGHAPAVPHPRRGPGRRRRARARRSPRRPRARRASPSRRSPRSPRAA